MSMSMRGQSVHEIRQQIQDVQREVRSLRSELTEVNSLFNLSLSLSRRLTGSENIKDGTIFAQRFIITLNQLRLAILAVQAASGPIGWALAIMGLAAAGLSYGDMIESGMNTR